ncbi:family 4 glycosyltransferase [Cryphonectria parasitica EP155]|uniref:Alpha-1,3/1,6-mannosyltransferase ALG2 n=1 Tax=Cryphonectria parasitica (strain ATCC 38755 / EP155) TaxID=660469 RepID=A0A9P4Y3W7_CRYP1|nr:family 4 glycosyltransferase [Cryphonectria parasitica EP155]KAF3766058.1 family 4 glycosyltransferase [Cryphonectria parasitica EP155]
MATTQEKKKSIVFFHPDLGIGGAERLVVDAAVGLQNRGHKITIFTSHCDPNHCFDEARNGTLDVRVRGNTIVPPSILSRFSILCAILRQAHLLIQIKYSGELDNLKPDAFFVDQLSAGLPLLQIIQPRSPILFYCHFPDLLLVQGRQNLWKRLYRILFDVWEGLSMSFADAIAVNSKFTRGVVGRTWPSLAKEKELKVVYPCIDTRVQSNGVGQAGGARWEHGPVILSINRFERKKDVALVIKAFAGLSRAQRKGVKLVVAGGYDPRVSENVGYHNELVSLAESLGLAKTTVRSIQPTLAIPSDAEVIFLLSVPNSLKQKLLGSAKLLVYTPSNEHFGIVPLEAMLSGVPVLAANTGGPTETVVEDETGWLRDPEQVGEWTKVMNKVLNEMSKDELAEMSRSGIARVRGNFADTQMAQRLDEIFVSGGGLFALLISGALVSLVILSRSQR